MSQSLINVDNVSKSYGGVKANVDISMTVKQGSITGIIGPNGCGKTTLFNSIVGYHPIDASSIQFDGQEVSHLRVGEIARLACCEPFSRLRIYTKMDCVDNMQISVSQRPGSKSQCFQAVKVRFAIGLNNCWSLSVSILSRNLISGDLSFGNKSFEFANGFNE